MAKEVEFIINMAGNATKGVTQLSNAVESARTKVTVLKTAFATIGSVGSQLMGVIYSVQAITSKFKEFTDASEAQNVAQTKLSKVMRNTMNASDEEYKSILKLTEQQQKLGVIGDEIQLAGAQELSTYLTKTDSLKKLLPVMNDMLAQQYGVNASQEQAVTIGSMIGKVMNGQVGALSRYGYKFDETQEKIIKFGTEEQKLAAVMDIVNEAVGGMNQELANSPEDEEMQCISERIFPAKAGLRKSLGKGLFYLDFLSMYSIMNKNIPIKIKKEDFMSFVYNNIAKPITIM